MKSAHSSEDVDLGNVGYINSLKNRIFDVDCAVIFISLLAIMVGFIALTATNIGSQLIAKSSLIAAFTDFLFSFKALPLLAILTPFLGGFVETYYGTKSDNLRDVAVVNTTFITLLLVLAMYPQVAAGTLTYNIANILNFGLYFKVDMLSLVMAITTSILWLMVMIYSHDYMMVENHRSRFYFFMSITFGAILGCVLAGDIFTMFLFFEIMTFSSYMLVTHSQNEECISAGYTYIYIGILGGLSILLGIILLYINTGTLAFVPMASIFQELGTIRYWIIGLFIFGFGIKAGMAPVHVWLPRAHPVAPTPASALLSGIMIKIGAYGILRVTTTYAFPLAGEIEGYKDILWTVSKSIGSGMIWLGIGTMALGVFLALQQGNIKRMLAYHSVSQMGYILMGIGVALYLGHKGAMGYAGSIYHIINHALFKSVLFMVAGVVYLRTHETDMYKLGGLWRKLPFTAVACLVAALGITGMPGFNGFASKSILHHAIIEAYEYGHPAFRYAEIMFTIISAGTVCSFIKLFGFVFLGRCPEKYQNIKGGYRMMDMAMGGLSLLIIGIGLRPNYLMNQFIIPAARNITYDPYFIDKYLVDMNFFNATDMTGMVWVYLLGALIFILGIKFHLFHLHFPYWLKTEYIVFYPMNKLLQAAGKGLTSNTTVTNTKNGKLPQGVYAITPHQGNNQSSQEGVINRFVSTVDLFTSRYEARMIKNDTVIYSILVTIILAVLVIFN